MRENTKKTININRPAAAGMWYTFTAILERGASLLFTPLYTRLLSPEQYGVYSIYTSYMGIFTVFLTLQLTGTVIYRGLSEFSNQKEFISSAFGLMLFSSALFLALYLLFSEEISLKAGLGKNLTLVLFFQIFLNGIRALKLSEARHGYRHRLSLLEGALFSLGAPLLSLILISFSDFPELSRIYALLIISLSISLPLLFLILKEGKFRLYSRPVWSFLLKFTLPTLPHYLAMALIWQIGKIFVGRYFSSAEAGIFSLAISIGFIPSLISGGMQSALIPWMNRKLDEGEAGKEKIHSLIYSVFIPFLLITLLFLTFSPELIKIMAPREYGKALFAVYPIALSVTLSFLINLFSPIISYYKRTYLVTVGSVCGAALSIILNLALTPRLGFIFSAFVQLPVCLLIFFIYSLILKKKLGHTELLAGRLTASFFLLILFSALSLFLRDSLAARIFFGAAVILMLLPRLTRLKVFFFERKTT